MEHYYSERSYELIEEIVIKMLRQGGDDLPPRSMSVSPDENNRQDYSKYIWESDRVKEFIDIDSYDMGNGYLRIQGYIEFKDHQDILNISNPKAVLQYLRAEGRKDITYDDNKKCYVLEIWSSKYYYLPF